MPADGTGFVPERAPCGGRAGRNALEQMAISHVQLEDMAVLLPWSNGNSHPSLAANCFRACREALMLAFLAFASSVGSSCPLPSKRADNRGSRSHPVFASTSANIRLREHTGLFQRLATLYHLVEVRQGPPCWRQP